MTYFFVNFMVKCGCDINNQAKRQLVCRIQQRFFLPLVDVDSNSIIARLWPCGSPGAS